jgi:hypothetical protein
MFIKGSRYRGLPESSPIDAAGERLLGKNLRVIPPPLAWPFRHTVREGDRLDLLSFKYYTDPTKWWQICDANPGEPYPSDLLDRRPLVKERFLLRSLKFEKRFRDLVLLLSGSGQVSTPLTTSFEGSNPAEPSFVETTVTVTYAAPATHQSIVNKIQAANIGFRFRRAFAWADPPRTAEAFTFDDPVTRNSWRTVVTTLAGMGVLELESAVVEGILDLTYNSAITPRESILTVISANGFSSETTAFPPVGTQIVIPPNQAV